MLPFLAEAADDPTEQCQRPVALVDPLRGKIDGGLELEPAFGVSEIEREDGLPATAALRVGVVAFVGHEMAECGEQKRAEPTAGGNKIPEIPLLDQARKKALG